MNTRPAAEAAARTPVVLLHDAAVDEMISSLLLTVMPGIDLLGLIIVNADCLAEAALEGSSKLQQFLKREDIPVALSRARGWNAFPWEYRTDSVNFAQIPILKPYTPKVASPPPNGEELLTRLLEEALAKNAPLTLLITGPLTPVVEVVTKKPALAKAVHQIAWMGGAIRVAGNLDPSTVPPAVCNTHAEWNAFWDPFAVAEVFRLFKNIHVFPLDISNQAPVSKEFMDALKLQAQQYTYSKLAFEAYSLVVSEPFYRLWDVTATCWLTRPDLYQPVSSLCLTVTQWGFEQGRIQSLLGVPDGIHSQNVHFAFADMPGFYQYVLELLATSGK